MDGRAAPAAGLIRGAVQDEGHRRADIFRQEAQPGQRVSDHRVERGGRFPPGATFALAPQGESQPGLVQLLPRQQHTRSAQDPCRAFEYGRLRDLPVAGQRPGPDRQLGHFTAPSFLVGAEVPQQAGHHRQIDAADDEPVLLERRVVHHFAGVDADPIEPHEGGRSGPQRAVPLPAERSAHDGEHEIHEEGTRRTFGEVRQHREERQVQHVGDEAESNEHGVGEPDHSGHGQGVGQVPEQQEVRGPLVDRRRVGIQPDGHEGKRRQHHAAGRDEALGADSRGVIRTHELPDHPCFRHGGVPLTGAACHVPSLEPHRPPGYAAWGRGAHSEESSRRGETGIDVSLSRQVCGVVANLRQ